MRLFSKESTIKEFKGKTSFRFVLFHMEQFTWTHCFLDHLLQYYLFRFSAQGQDLAPLFGSETKVKVPFEIKPPLGKAK